MQPVSPSGARRLVRGLSAAAIGVLVGAAPVEAQVQVRGRAVTTVRYIEFRLLSFNQADSTFGPGELTHAAPLTQDVELSAWGFGIQGLRAYALVRGRAALGDAAVWPRSDDHFDALWGFVELERPRYRLRLGRQQRASGLGFYAFDGALATWRPLTGLRLEGYAGRALARGFLEPTGSQAIRALDPFLPDRGSVILGTSAWVAPSATSSFSALYQVVELNDFSGVVSERAALDGQLGIGRSLVVRGNADYDIGMGSWGKARLGALWRFGRASAEAGVFRYRPTFDLTTIWGVFAPQSHRGFDAAVHINPTARLAMGASYLYRKYRPTTETTPFDIEVDDATHQLELNSGYTAGDFRVSGAYRLSTGFGGWRSGGQAEVAWDRDGRWELGVHGVAFQSLQEFRVANGTVRGAGASARAGFTRWLSVHGQVTRYWHRDTRGQSSPDWSQLRADLGVEIGFGANADRARGSR